MFDCQELYSSTSNLWCFKWRYLGFNSSHISNIDVSKTKKVFDLKHINKNKKEIGLCVIINNNSGDQKRKKQ